MSNEAEYNDYITRTADNLSISTRQLATLTGLFDYAASDDDERRSA